jgi:hypothetical protein
VWLPGVLEAESLNLGRQSSEFNDDLTIRKIRAVDTAGAIPPFGVVKGVGVSLSLDEHPDELPLATRIDMTDRIERRRIIIPRFERG